MPSEFTFKRPVIALAAAALLVALVAGCGGDKKDDKSGSDAGTSTSTGASSSTPARSATSSSGASSTSGLSDLKSYKYSLKMSGNGGPVGELSSSLGGSSGSTNAVVEVSGAYIKPDRAQTSIKVAGLEISTVVIGSQQWNTFAGQTQGPTSAAASDLEDANFLLGFWEGDDLSASIKDFKCGGKETVNGVSAKKCTADKATLEKLSKENSDFLAGINASSLSNAQVDVWLTDADYPVRMRMDVSGKDTANKDFNFKVEMDVTDINGNFQITAPKT